MMEHHQAGNWDLVIKVKYGNALKRFSTFVKQSRLEYNMAKLRSKIRDAFNLGLDAELVLTYEDEDGDAITLELNEDLIDATMYQQLNPLRIEARLRNPSSEPVHSDRKMSMSMSGDSKSDNGAAMQELDPLRRINLGGIGGISRSFYSDRYGCHSSPHVCGLKPKKLKLKSRFVQDVTIPDGTGVLPSTSFTKIWRIYNNGKDLWPYGTQLVCVGGDQMANSHAVQLQIPPTGFPVQGNIDVQVDFVAPSKPGRHISFWRLVSPSGKKFGHFFWVMIKVELPSTDTGNSSPSLDLDLPPDSKCARAESPGTLEDEVTDQVTKKHDIVSSSQISDKDLIDLSEYSQYVNLTVDLGNKKELVSDSDQLLAELHDMVELPSTNTGNSSPSLDLDLPPNSKCARAELLETLEDQAIHQVTKKPDIVSSSQISDKDLINLSEDSQYVNLTVDLENNKEPVSDSDQLLAELHDMGFSDEELNRRLLAEYGGSIKKVVLNLVAREKMV